MLNFFVMSSFAPTKLSENEIINRYDNVNSCLTVLRQHQVGGLESVTPNDICSGRLKAVLSLFFALSRYKQATKQKAAAAAVAAANAAVTSTTGFITHHQQQQQQQQQQTKVEIHAPPADMTNRQLPVPYTKPGVNGGTAIPLPATVMVTRRCPPDKVRPLPPTPNQQTGLHPACRSTPSLAATGRRRSPGRNQRRQRKYPHDGNSCPGSPQHNGTAIITQIPKGGSSLRPPQTTCKIPASPYATQTIGTNHINNNNNSSNSNHNNNVTLIPNGNVTNIPNPTQKQSMLEKLKLFNSKEKQDKTSKSTISKRTSSSSGFSSARSERRTRV
ncbi:protein sickie-like [Armigeres subalbatus]|uniref:protein sickie-like n=1 Tax=Armigeres subalbatus TaxID=124917 RepID=UPI002ED23191